MPSFASLAAAAALFFASADAATKNVSMNVTVYTDDTCTTISKVQTYDLDKCHRATIATCVGTNATLAWYDDTDKKCTGAVNTTKTYVTDVCTPTGPKGAKVGRKATCA
jgi:hypothetical protein